MRNLQSLSVSLNEDQEKIVRAKEALDAERESMKGDTRTLANLRSEHARLKEDFRSLFTANDTVKADYRTLQSEYKVKNQFCLPTLLTKEDTLWCLIEHV